MTRWLRSPLGTFVALSFAVSWALWLPVAVLFPDAAELPWWALVPAFLGAYGPSVAAVVAARVRGPEGELRELVGRLVRWRVGWGWYAVALLGPPAFIWVGAGLYGLSGVSLAAVGAAWPASALLVLATFVPFGPLGEELGWRGYALPRLDRRFPPLVSAVLLGIIWAAWHAPAFWVAPIGMPGRSLQAAGMWAANVVSFSILLSWLVRRTAYSVPIAILLHATLNAGPAMGRAALDVSPVGAEAIGSGAGVVRWLVTLAAALALAREPRGPAPEPVADTG